MPPGPHPSKKKRRRNAPTIPTTELPATGRKGRPPKVPGTYKLGVAGAAWWKWAWRLPQAVAWNVGDHYLLARRASLEDDLAALEDSDNLLQRVEDSILRILESEDPGDVPERLRYLGLLLGNLKALGGGKLAIAKEMREMDKVLGLTPAGLAALRWEIVDDAAPAAAVAEESAPDPKAKKSDDRKKRLALVKSG